jgi:hypothetical protein
MAKDVRIVVGDLGDRAPALGAAAIALEANRSLFDRPSASK